MSQVCSRCYRIVDRACQSETEATDCPALVPIANPMSDNEAEMMAVEMADKAKRRRT